MPPIDEINKGLRERVGNTTNRPKGKNYLLAIGINDYAHCPKLSNAVNDAKAFVELMKEKYQFEEKYVRTLYDEKGTEEDILDQFQWLVENVTPNDNCLVYFSGHGEYSKIFKQGYWIPVEARLNKVGDYISNSTIKDVLSAINSHHTFLIADSCFSGSLFARGTRNATSERLFKHPSRWGLTSGRNELVSDGGGEHSPFAESLLYVLENNTKNLGVASLCSQVLEMTVANANQTPLGEPLKVEGHKNGQFVFHLKKDEYRDWLAAKTKNTVAAYTSFLAMYPNGKYTAEAKQLKNQLAEETTWEKATTTNTIVAYFEYMDAYPKGKYTTEAFGKIKELEDDQHWQNAIQKNTITGFLSYVKQHPSGKYRDQASENISKLRNQTYKKEEPKVSYQQSTSIAQQSTPKPKRQKEQKKPITSSFDIKKLPWKWVGTGIAVLVLMIALSQSSIFSPKPPAEKLTFVKGDNGKLGLKKGDKWIVQPKFDEAKPFREELAAVDYEGAWGFIGPNGKVEIDFKYAYASSFFEGAAAVFDGKYYGYIDVNGTTIIPFEYEESADFKKGMVWVQKDGKAFYINKKGECVLDCPDENSTSDKDDPFANDMVSVQGGSFKMGCDDTRDGNCNTYEKPVHEVILSSFYISKYEVTQAQWRAVTGTNPSNFKNCDNCPVEMVSWNDIQAFLKKLNGATGKKYRLPTEAEWEYAARGGNKSKGYKYSGSNTIENVAWYEGNSAKKTHPVGTKSPNELGLYDMSGNVYEWCSDWYGENYYKKSPSKNPKEPTSGDYRVLRGGSWSNYDYYCRVANRYTYNPNNTYNLNGFRIAQDM